MLENPLLIDRRLRDVALSHARFRSALHSGRAEDHAFELIGARVSDELFAELESEGADDPFGPALLRWAYVLHEAHALVPSDQALAEAWHGEQHRFDRPLGATFTLAELRARALADRGGGRELFLTALLERAERASDRALWHWERRTEHATALRIRDLDALEGVTPALLALPEELIAATNEPFRELAVNTLGELVALAVGDDRTATWPAHLSPRSLATFFDASLWFRHTSFELDALPPPAGSSSFLRGLGELGRALRKSFVSQKLPFCVAHDPFDLEASTWGALFALLPLGESFATRELGVARIRIADHRRSLGAVLLVAARQAAFRSLYRSALLRGENGRKTFVELGERIFSLELPPRAAGALFCPDPASPHHVVALALAAELDARLTESHDEDWYRNPRAVTELREEAARAPECVPLPERVTSGLATLAKRLWPER